MFAPFPEEEAYEYCLKLFRGLSQGVFSLEQVTAVSEERAGNGLMIGAAVCKRNASVCKDDAGCAEDGAAVCEQDAAVCKQGAAGAGERIILVTCSGISKRIAGLQNSGMQFVEPVVSASQIDSALKQNDAQIHLLTQKINELTQKIELSAKEGSSNAGSSFNSASSSNTESSFAEEKALLVKQRTALTTESLQKVHALYSFHCADGSVKTLSQICAEQNISGFPPTGIGDCCAPKLLDYAFANSLTVKSMCEVFYDPAAVCKKNVLSANSAAVSANSAAVFAKENILPQKCAPCNERCGILLPSMLGLRIVYRDNDIIVVNKQSGVLSVPGRGPEKQDCIVNRVRRLFPQCIIQPSVHRLDMETSGLMVLAFTAESQRNLRIQFEKSEVSKKYIALVDGVLAKKNIPSHGSMELFFRLDVDNRPHQIWDSVNGKSSVTEWNILNVENYFSPDGTKHAVTRIEYIPHTGRTHQLRLASADSHGFATPIIGDTLYGTCLPGERLCLHASYLRFSHPVTGRVMEFSSPAEF